ncbi:MAG TPA: trigger factor [Thermomicrobiales bacterium]|nr:trigger factor [Thermomicrobiales bacterium]
MKLSVERQAGSLVLLDITAEDEEFSQAMDRAFRRAAKDIQVPGFRKGKAPRTIIERYYGREVFVQDAAEEVMDSLYRKALEQEEITPVGEPDVSIESLEPVNFKVTVPVYPTIETGDYTSVRVEPEDASVTDEDVNEVLERLQKSQATWSDPAEPRTPREGDQVNVDYEVKEGDEDFQEPVKDAQFVLGETNLLQPLRERIEEMHVGDTETFDLVFDENDETADPSIRGKTLTYTVTLNSVKERELPEIDDELAKSAADAGSLEDLKAQIRDDVHQGKTTEARQNVVNNIINQIAENAEVDPPAVMVDEEVQHQLNHLKQNLAQSGTPYEAYLRAQNTTEEQVKEELRPEAERRLRNSLILQEIGRREQVEVTDADIDAELDRILGPVGDDEQSQRMREMYQSDYFRNLIRNEMFDRKLTDRIIEIATEGKVAVTNAWEPPTEEEAAQVAARAADAESEAGTATEEAPTSEEGSAETEQAAASGVASEPAAGAAPTTAEATNSVITNETAEEGNQIAEDVVAGEGDNVQKSAEASPKLEGERGEGWVKGDGTNNPPEGYPIKGNANSMIYHPPESRSYANTVAEYYFATAEVAESFGFRPPRGINRTSQQ